MKFFSGFCLKNDKKFFKDYIEDGFTVAGFSKGAQDALDYVLNSKERIDKLQLFSPAFFDYNNKLINMNLKAFKKDKEKYLYTFLSKAGAEFNEGKWHVGDEILELSKCEEKDLFELFTFEWGKIKRIKHTKIEVFLGEFDKIIALKKAHEFFKNYADVYFIKKADHFLRSID